MAMPLARDDRRTHVKAFAILDGGGVKGAALVGCLAAADERGIKFVGYGGTSAGAFVALLAAIGYTPREMRSILVARSLTDWLDDDGTSLDRLREFGGACVSFRSIVMAVAKHRKMIRRVTQQLGLYPGDRFSKALLKLCIDKHPEWEGKEDITFKDLEDAGCRPLRVVVSDLGRRAPLVCGRDGEAVHGDPPRSVIMAVRASMSYPFVFKPVPVFGYHLVDGGLSSNLPMFLFEDLRLRNQFPLIAFDLVASRPEREGPYSFKNFLDDMLETALDSGEHLQRDLLRNVYHVVIRTPEAIGTLDFRLSEEQRERLYLVGHEAASRFFATQTPHWLETASTVESLQAVHGREELVETILQAVKESVESRTPARDVRCNIMLPTGRGTRIIVYSYNMDGDPDMSLELAEDAGVSGAAFAHKRPVVGDIGPQPGAHQPTWGLSPGQLAQIRRDRRAVLSVPIYERNEAFDKGVDQLDVIGTLSVDSSTRLELTGWTESAGFRILIDWADVLTKVLR